LSDQETPQETLARPVKPRDAASLVLIDTEEDEPRILMGKRHARMKFTPDAYVFPGGKLDAGDFQPTPATPLNKIAEAQMTRAGSSPKLAQALAMAAIRETFEETGLFLAAPGDVGPTQDESWQAFRNAKLAPKLDTLSILARAITPTLSPIRFHARFFEVATNARDLTGTLKGSGELSDLDWYPLSQALELPIIDVTQFILEEIQARQPDWQQPETPPLYCYRNGIPRTLRF